MGPAQWKYNAAEAITARSWVKRAVHRSGTRASSKPNRPSRPPASAAASQAARRARATLPAPIAMPTSGTDATPMAKAIGTSKNSSRVPMP